MGASGIIGQLINGKQDTENLERIVFLIGVIAAPFIILQFSDFSKTNVTSNSIQLVLAGLLVGLGTRIANGGTSSYGFCVISRLSLKGLLATAVYIAAGWASIAKKVPLFDRSFSMPSNKTIYFKSLAGSVLFGIGWALADLFPGPAIAALGFGGNGIIMFFVPMLFGMILTKPIRMGSISTIDG